MAGTNQLKILELQVLLKTLIDERQTLLCQILAATTSTRESPYFPVFTINLVSLNSDPRRKDRTILTTTRWIRICPFHRIWTFVHKQTYLPIEQTETLLEAKPCSR